LAPTLSWRYARASDIDRYYGARPQYPLNAAVVLLDDKPVGVVGVSREYGTGLFFSDVKPELDMKRMVVLRAITAAMAIVRKYPCPVYARADTDEGHRLLRRLGFTNLSGEVYQWVT
jgi:hypothetical protein